MKLSPHRFAQYRTHHEIDVDMDEEFWPVLGILLIIWGAWTGVVHFLDWLTVDAIIWWSEPLTIIPFLFLLVMKERFEIKLPDDERITIYPINGEDLIKEHGGPLQVHIVDYEHIKFRRKRDAVIFSLRNF
jgi:hypothetical protein